MLLRVRNLRRRRNNDGTRRYYWIKGGFPVHRLSDDPALAAQRAQQLNILAKAGQLPRVSDGGGKYGTVSWAVHEFRKSEAFVTKAQNSKDNYEVWLRRIDKAWGKQPMTAITRAVVVQFMQQLMDRPGARRMAFNVLKHLIVFCMDMEVPGVTDAPIREIKKGGVKRRDQVWERGQSAARLRALRKQKRFGRAAAIHHILMRYTAQRSVDCITMTLSAYDGANVDLVQQKTGRALSVPCHRSLRTFLDIWKRNGRVGRIVPINDDPKRVYRQIYGTNAAARAVDGLSDLQDRDLRRTAAVELYIAGAKLPDIAGVLGNSIDECKQITETYLPMVRRQAALAVSLWEQRGGDDRNEKANAKEKTK